MRWVRVDALLTTAALSLGLLTGCASVAGRAAGKAVPTAIEGSLATLDAPENRATIQRLLTSPEVNEGVRQLAASITSGAFSELSSEERAQELEELATRLSAAFANGLIASAAEPHNRATLNRLANELSHSVSRAILDEAGATLSPSDREEFIRAVRSALFEASREMSSGIVAGFYDAVEKQREERGIAPEESLMGQLRSLTARGKRLTSGLAVALVLACLVLVILLIYLTLRHRKERETLRHELLLLAQRRNEAASAESLAQALSSALQQPELRQLLMNELRREQHPPPTH
jgi:hypothetical protein